jgi:hypothetical protein
LPARANGTAPYIQQFLTYIDFYVMILLFTQEYSLLKGRVRSEKLTGKKVEQETIVLGETEECNKKLSVYLASLLVEI